MVPGVLNFFGSPLNISFCFSSRSLLVSKCCLVCGKLPNVSGFCWSLSGIISAFITLCYIWPSLLCCSPVVLFFVLLTRFCCVCVCSSCVLSSSFFWFIRCSFLRVLSLLFDSVVVSFRVIVSSFMALITVSTRWDVHIYWHVQLLCETPGGYEIFKLETLGGIKPSFWSSWAFAFKNWLALFLGVRL